MNLLCIESATKVCSVALAVDGKLSALKEVHTDDFSHAENLAIFIQEVLNESNLKTTDLDAIAISKGPGSYTGLRIGVSTAKGLAYGLKIPLISVSTLQAMASGVKTEIKLDDNTLLCPMIDARRMEVFAAIYDSQLNTIREIWPDIITPESYQEFTKEKELLIFGDGAKKCTESFTTNNKIKYCKNGFPSAKWMIELAMNKFQNQDFENTAYFEPFYLKNFKAGVPKKIV